jgi:hypothetical protein
MSALDVLEVVAIFGAIVGAWFVFIGWKLLALKQSE